VPPFTAESAAQKVRLAEDAWNSRDPERVALAYVPDSRWRNRSEFISGRQAIVVFLQRTWTRELDYRLLKEVWAFRENRASIVEIEADGAKSGKVRLRGYSCPLASDVTAHPEVRRLFEALLAEVVGAPVKECCDRSARPRCGFEIATGRRRAA
jgi:hypothetical protein